ncbi:MAG: hypothetical protein KJ017_01290 [Alphaproteobacteria bacterium]|nr:hypothetical protein [Alphaproteobacteria bacterium]
MSRVSQQHSKAGGDIVAGDKVTTFNDAPKGKIEKLLKKLQEQYDGDEATQSIIDELARYHSRRTPDGVSGLEAKLEAAGKCDSFDDAIEKKEMFAKLLQKWTMYSSAQLIFSHILAKAEIEFTQVIYPQIPSKTETEINALVIERIVSPIVEECGDELLAINHSLVLGMVYWLAEQCFIRWHHPKQATQ